MSDNPLKSYFRKIGKHVKLASPDGYYSDDIVTIPDTGELPVYPMSGIDESNIKNPESLLNGRALIELIRSCVPAVHSPGKLMSCDVQVLVAAICHCTFGDSLTIEAQCPKKNCAHKDTYGLTTTHTLDATVAMSTDDTVVTNDGIKLKIRPNNYNETLQAMKAQFEQTKIVKTIQNGEMTDEEKLEQFSKSFKVISENTFKTICNSVISVEADGEVVTNREHINEFLSNVPGTVVKQIEGKLKEYANAGIPSEFSVQCTKCEEPFKTPIVLDPVTFSTAL